MSEAIAALPSVDGVMNYVAPLAEPIFNYTYPPPPGASWTNAVLEGHRVPIHDVRPIAASLSLDREGFELVGHHSRMHDFYDEDELRRVCYGEAEQLVMAATGATRAVVFDHTIRRRLSDVVDRTPGVPRQPVTRIHNDYTEKSGPQRVRDVLPNEAETLLKHRFAVINVWRPIRGPLRDAPLALCDAQSSDVKDFVVAEQIYPNRRGEIYLFNYNPAHRWCYVPAMSEDEALLLKCYDSSTSGVARFTAHAAFDDPTTPADALPRESIELRLLAFYPDS